ncbi:hypothetical protein [Mycoplasmopsis felifaucium]|uniref:hypothetical protein n=1 Tax=Mycoplasmopsis felifaucium TaxID=35768 RepID=UPI0004856F9E|nr:hypothetical protein [Mycoplasmopsis felifaucium]
MNLTGFKQPVKFENDVNYLKHHNIVEAANKADLNLFYNTYGQGIWNNFIRMSLMINGDIYFGVNSSRNGLSQQSYLNKELWTEFQHNHKVNPGLNSKIVFFDLDEPGKYPNIDDKYIAIPYWKQVIFDNPDKKINIWCRTGISQEDYYALSQFDNVVVNMIEENPSLFESWKDGINKMDTDFKLQTGKTIKDAEFNTLADLPQNYHNLLLYSNIKGHNKFNYWWSINEADSYFKAKGFNNQFLFSGVDESEKPIKYSITDALFNARDINKKRLSVAWWSLISGYNWERQKEIIDSVMNNSTRTKKIIFIGDANVRQWDLLITAFEKYGNEYEFFYKGHPGHTEIPKHIDKVINVANNLEYNNLLKGTKERFTMPEGRKITILDPQIISEELTTYHVDEGLKFEKFINSTVFSNAMLGMKNGYNDYRNDVLMALTHDGSIFCDFESANLNEDNLKTQFIDWFEKNTNK